MPVDSLAQQWISSHKDLIGALGTLCGILTTVLKEGIGFLRDHSTKKKVEAQLNAVGGLIRKEEDANKYGCGTFVSSLAPYRTILRERITGAIKDLEAANEAQKQQAESKYYEPKGIRRWLLLFRPSGATGWISHSCFYAVFVDAAVAVWQTFDEHLYSLEVLVVSLILSLFLILVTTSVAVNVRKVSILTRDRSDPNGDLTMIQKYLLLFKINERTSQIERSLLYLWIIGFTVSVILSPTLRSNLAGSSLGNDFLNIVTTGAIVWSLWYDVLMRRALLEQKSRK